MKRIGLFSFVVALAFQANAQTNQKLTPSTNVHEAEKHLVNVKNGLAGPSSMIHKYSKSEMKELGALAAPGDTLYNFDFSTASNWRITNGGIVGWSIVNAASSQSWFYTSTTLASATGFPYLSLNNGNPTTGAVSAATHFAETQVPINLSSNSFVHLQYTRKHERFQDTLQVLVSGNNGATWTLVDDNLDYEATTAAANVRNPNPDVRRFNISAAAGGSSQVVIRFRWRSRADGSTNDGVAYGALIDDVLILKAPHSDIDLNYAYTSGALDSGSNEFYTVMPARQAKDWEIKMGSDVFNNGRSVQTRTRYNVDVTADNGFSYSSSSNPVVLAPGTSQKMEDANFFKPNDGPGNYSIVSYPTSDSSLVNLANDTTHVDFMVSDSIFARDVASVSESNDGWSYNPSAVQDFEIGNLFEIKSLDTVSGFMFYVSSVNSPSQSIYTSSMSFAIHKFNPDSGQLVAQELFVSDNPAQPDPSNPDRYPVTAGMPGTWVYFPAKAAAGNLVDTIGPGTYWVTYRGNHTPGGDTLFHAYGGDFELFNRGLARSNSGGFFSYISRAPALRLVTKPFTCPDLKSTMTSNATSACGAADGSATVSPVNGVAPYTYTWGGGTIGGGQGTATATGLSAGIYTVTVTDANGCSEEVKATVSDAGAPVVTAQSIVHENCFGDADGKVILSLSGGTAPSYDFTWKDASGAIVAQGSDLDSLVGQTAGTYTVEVVDPNPGGCQSVASFTINGPTAALELPNPLSLSVILEDVSCNGAMDGEINIAAATGGSGAASSFTYQWSELNDLAFSATGLNLTGLNGGRYTCTVTDGNGCTATQAYIIDEPAAITINVSQNDINKGAQKQVIVTANGGNGTLSCQFYWENPNNGNAFEALETIKEQNKVAINGCNFTTVYYGQYKVVITDDNGCSSENTADLFVANTSGQLGPLEVGEAQIAMPNQVSIMPNPNNGSFTMVLPGDANGVYSVDVKNTLGQVVYEASSEVTSNEVAVEASSLDKGVYFVTLRNEAGSEFTGRFIVE